MPMLCNVNGIHLYYEKTGTGTPLILVHGNGETHKIFDQAIPLLAKQFTVYALDSRGHGQSEMVFEYHYADFAEDVRYFMQALKLESPVYYGFSDGGIIGLLLASQYPQIFSQLIISGVNTVPEGIWGGWRKWYQLTYAVTKDPKMKMMLEEPDITAKMLRKIQIPTTILAGSRDVIKRKHTQYIAHNIKNSTLHILKGEGHGSYIINSTKIAELILSAQ